MTTPRTEALRDWMFDMIDQKSVEGATRRRVDSFPALLIDHIQHPVAERVCPGGCHAPDPVSSVLGHGDEVVQGAAPVGMEVANHAATTDDRQVGLRKLPFAREFFRATDVQQVALGSPQGAGLLADGGLAVAAPGPGP